MTQDSNILFEKFDILECLKKETGLAVYSANHIYLGKRILLKTLDRKTIADPAMLDRFQREAKTLARLDHPNIIKVLDFGTFESFFYISFEYFDSRNLREVVKSAELSEKQKMAVCVQIFRGLEYAHSHNIIHRDIKPENILMNDQFHIKIADFGLARLHGEESLTLQTSIVGTPSYMSPEQIRGEILTPKSDIFSLGIVVLELFTGKNPFLGKDAGATLNNVLSHQIDATLYETAPPVVAEVLPRMLAKRPQDRFESVKKLLPLWGEQDNAVSELPKAEEKANSRFSSGVWRAAAALVFVILVSILIVVSNGKSPTVESENLVPLAQDSLNIVKEPQQRDSLNKTDTMAEAKITTEMPQQTEPVLEKEPDVLNIPGRLMVRCSPWAVVYIDNDSVDTTPMEEPLHILPGEHELKLHHPNFPIYVKNIRINPDEEKLVAVDLDTLYGFFTCDIYPWAEVVIDDETRGTTPLRPLLLTPGSHILTVKNQQYGTVSDTFYVQRQDTFHYQLNFERLVRGSVLN